MKLIHLRNTFLATSAETERVFSSMKRLKRPERSTLSDSNTENLVLLCNHKALMHALDDDSIIDKLSE